MTLEVTHSATSSQESGDGVMHFDSQGGPMTDLFGQALVHASPSVPQESSVAARMSATYGLRSSTSSASAALELSLASRLPEVLATHGGTMWRQTWKVQATPQRRRILAHIASGEFIIGSGFIGALPTPTKTDHKGGSINPLRYAKRGDKSNLRDWFMSRHGFRYPPAGVVRWMMGFPSCWLDSAMPSSRRLRQRS
jgi:hypothetical protein